MYVYDLLLLNIYISQRNSISDVSVGVHYPGGRQRSIDEDKPWHHRLDLLALRLFFHK